METCPVPVTDPSGAVLTFMLTVPENCIDEQRQMYSPWFPAPHDPDPPDTVPE